MGLARVLGALLLTAIALFEWRYARECAPAVSARLARHRTIAYDVRCNEATPQHAAWREHLDCEEPRRTVAKGYALALLECMAARHPFAGYASLIEPLAFPRFSDKPHEWLLAAAFAAAVLWVLAPLTAGALSLWREERMRAGFRADLDAMRAVAEQSGRGLGANGPVNYVYVAPPQRRSLGARGDDFAPDTPWFGTGAGDKARTWAPAPRLERLTAAGDVRVEEID